MIDTERPSDLASTSGRTWDEASSPAAARLVRRFEEDWRRSTDRRRPDPAQYLPEAPSDRPGAWLALLRADMGLRWDAGESATVEQYRLRYPDLDEQTLVALLYEEFCLLEESGSDPDPADFERRFPELASALRRVLDIHDLIGGSDAQTLGSTRSLPGARQASGEGADAPADAVEFPEAGETIGGFRLIEELGRGSFARVYLALERLLADRPVALKVATTGSREPQTLARLQHTYIVPVHSYRDDPVTGLHLLCMPFFGRTTLADLLADPAIRSARSGGDLLAILDRIEPPETGKARPPTASRTALAGRSFAGAIAWWGARLAEALQHAHDRGVLHRDVKPTNVLVTGDGLPMLLDFNLAMGPVLDDPADESAKLGGTLAYMAPEHIEALADGIDSGVDARADIFALGVVLFEAITGDRPFAVVRQARSVAEALLRTAEQRRGGLPGLRRAGRAVSPALEAVIKRSLEPDPGRRYQSAAELAADLQAVGEDLPLRFAAEPLASRSLRWIRRNRIRFAVAAPPLVAIAFLTSSYTDSRARLERARAEVEHGIEQADLQRKSGKLEAAIQGYEFAMQAAARYPNLSTSWGEAQKKLHWSKFTLALEREATRVFEGAENLRYRLLGFVESERPSGEALRELLHSFAVFERIDWASSGDLRRLQPERRQRLLDEVPELLFLLAVHLWLTGTEVDPTASEIADLRDRAVRAMPLDDPRRVPWDALCRELGITRPAVAPAPDASGPLAGHPRHGAEAAFLWGIASAARYQGTNNPADSSRAISWLEAAAKGRPDAYWPRFYLATFALESGRIDDSLRHADAAVALNPSTPWALYNRALAARASGDTASALGDLQAAWIRIPGDDVDGLRDRVQLNLGLVLLERGDLDGARVALEAVVGGAPAGVALGKVGAKLVSGSMFSALGSGVGSAAGAGSAAAIFATDGSWFGRAARLNLARIDAEEGRPDLALLSYSDLLLDEPNHWEARLGRALLLLSSGDARAALADAERLIAATSVDRDPSASGGAAIDARRLADLIELRARCLLAIGQAEEAREAAARAFAMAPNPSRSRLQIRALLATEPGASLRLDDPASLDLLPGPGLSEDLREAERSMEAPPPWPESSPVPRVVTRAVLLSALGEADEAEAAASQAVLIAPDASHPRLVRARIRHRSGDLAGALDDLDAALELLPDDPAALAFRGQVLGELGRHREALASLDRARALGRDDASLHRSRALTLASLGQTESAIAAMTEAIARDPHDPRLLILRSRLFLGVGRRSAARADLDRALDWSTDRPEIRAVALALRAFVPRPLPSRPTVFDHQSP